MVSTLQKLLPQTLQMLILVLIWLLADRLTQMLHLPVSGGIVGMLFLVILLLAGVVKAPHIEGGANLLLANMLLYFIPLVVSIVQYTQLIETQGLRLFAAIGLGFISVMVSTAFIVECVCQLTRKRHLQRLLLQRSERRAQ